MHKIWYTDTSWDNGGPVFVFNDGSAKYMVRFAGNPLLLLESYYNINWWTNFMEVYNSIKQGNIEKEQKKNIKALEKAQKSCKEFFSAVLNIQTMQKSTLVVYKN